MSCAFSLGAQLKKNLRDAWWEDVVMNPCWGRTGPEAEGCAAILWKVANEQTNTSAASALKLTASDNMELGIIDAVVPEPVGGAHRDPSNAAGLLKGWIVEQLKELRAIPIDELLERRYQRFRRLGACREDAEAAAAILSGPDAKPSRSG
ncbi:hypothetical protein J4558_24650 [Leptolyngbya sp. 15MV]|nr:hypothetical protein J4558_24650 [Leptolyngbya sp. 15MV]